MKRILVLLLLFVMMVSNLLMPKYVYASTETLTINADGDTNLGAPVGFYSGGAANFTNMQSDDGDATIFYIGAIGYKAWHTTNTTNTSINSVTAYVKTKAVTAANNARICCIISGTIYYGSVELLPNDGTYHTYSKTWATSPATGIAWTTAEINAAQFGIDVLAAGLSTVYTTYVYVVVDYTLQLPTSTTNAPTSILTTSATLNGTITDDGGDTMTNYGFVWDTTSRADPGNTAPAASAYANNWTIGAGSYAEGSFSHATGAVLVAGTTYYVRFASQNSVGWDYGDEYEFSTVGTPSGTTMDATLVGSGAGAGTGVARLNAMVTDANGQLCDVRFGYDTVTRANVALYANITAWVEDTYNTGTYPYVDITGLDPATTYYFRVAVRNDAGTGEGAELTFTTPSGVNEPTSIIAIPTATSISLLWVKGSGATYTLIRYSTGGYPTTTAAGTLVYLDTNNSYELTGLDEGTTYYFSAWGKTGALYSAAYTTVLTTTLGYTEPTMNLDGTRPTNTSFTRDPSTTKVGAIPVLGTMISSVATSYTIPEAMLWYFLWILGSSFVGIVMYNITSKNLNVALTATLCCVGLGIYMELVMLWVLFFMLLIGIGWILYGERR